MDKYPFINVKFYRSGDVALLTKIFAEAQAKRNIVDIVDITGIGAEILRKRGLFAKYISPHWKFYSAGSKDPEGYWTDMYTNLNVIGYNTKLVSPKEVPKTYEDFLAPKWKGKIGMDTKAYYWFANILKVMGEKKGLDYMKRLAEQNIQFRTGRTLNAQMVAAGEVSIGIALYNQRVEEIKAKGAAMEWVAIEPVVPEIHPLLISANAPNPNAARLLVDYLLSREGQEVIASFLRIPSRIDVDPILPKLKKGIKVLPFDSGITDDYDRYIKLYREVLMKK
jgi:iron(III) transport system substrate-binding protein